VGLTGLSVADMTAAFADIAKTGATTVRTMYINSKHLTDLFLKTNVYDCGGFNEVTSANGATTSNYYQIWSDSTATINTGPTGLQNFGLFIAFDQISVCC
jgi:mannan endo-1,4-beta-mannosidase